MLIDPKDWTIFDISLAPKVSTIMPQGIENSFLLFERKNECGLKLPVDPKFWDRTHENSSQHVKTSLFCRYDQGQLFEKLTEALASKKGQKFLDDYYPPTLTSLIPSVSKTNLNENWFKLKWVRLGDLYKNQTMSLADQSTFTPSDVLQGYFGDSYLSNTLSCLAEFPDLTRQMFGYQKPNNTGIYHVRLFDNGVPYTAIVDDYIPCLETEDGVLEPAFVQSRIKSGGRVDIAAH